MAKMQKERLALLRDALRAPLPPKTTFDLKEWRKKDGCGAVCCAVGLAMGMPEFNKMGLSAVNGYYIESDVPSFAGRARWPAVNALFGLTEKQSLWLFHHGDYGWRDNILPTEVADRIDALMQGGTLNKARAILKGDVS